MVTFVEAFDKSKTKMLLGWSPEPAIVASYNLYVGLTSGSLSQLAMNISPTASQLPMALKKVSYEVMVEDVQALLSLPITADFSNIILFWAVTWVDRTGAESEMSNVAEIPPAGVTIRTMKDDPSISRQLYGFSDELLRWVKLAASSGGALVTTTSSFYAPNTVTEYTYDGTNVATEKTYSADSTVAGSPAKLVTYEYSAGLVSKVTVTDSTV